MGRVRGKLPSPAMGVAIVALVLAVAGSALAGVATVSVLNKKEKKQTRKIARSEINKAAPGLSVAKAANADALGGELPSAFQTRATFRELTTQPDLTATEENIITTSIAIEETKTVIAVATIEAEAPMNAVVHRVGCRMNIAGAQHDDAFADTIPVTGDADETTLTLNFARELPAGTHDVALRCRMISGSDLFVEDGWLSVWAVG
jgi:hypothetical protein